MSLPRQLLFLLCLGSPLWAQSEPPTSTKRSHASAAPVKRVLIDRAAAARHRILHFGLSLPIAEAQKLHVSGDGAGPPVLLPDRPELLSTAFVVTGPHWYAVSFEGAGYGVFVMGRAAAVSMPGLRTYGPYLERARLERPRITRVHEIVTATFSAWGASYDVDIECVGGLDHPMCADDALIRELVYSLARLGGLR